MINLKSYGKINLGLDVVRRLPNGYHEVKMVMQTVGLYDDLSFEKMTDSGDIILTANTDTIPTDDSNIIVKAAKLIKETYGVKDGVKISLTKRIPVAAGMAGGSGNAAATLVGMNRLFGLGLDVETLKNLGVKLGADVPYCIMGGTALSEGIGEKLTKLPDMPDCHILLAKPDISVSTKWVYESLNLNEDTFHPDIDGMVDAINTGSLAGVTDRMANVLETVTVTKHTIITDIKNDMVANGAENALMSGSGPTVFGIFKEKNAAENAAASIEAKSLANTFVVKPISGDAIWN